MSVTLPKISVVTPRLHLGDPIANAKEIISIVKDLDSDFVVTPELSLTGYTCQDLFFQQGLLDQAMQALNMICQYPLFGAKTLIVGVPLNINDRLFNCAVAIKGNKILGVVPKTYLPNYGEFYEQRWFASSKDATRDTIDLFETSVPFGAGMVFEDRINSVRWGIEICEDLWAVIPPSNKMALAGAQMIFNLSASNELISKSSYRRELVKSQSGRLMCAYAYVSAGPWESASDTVFSGHSIIAENDSILVESDHFKFSNSVESAHIDIAQLKAERLRNSTFSEESVGNIRFVQYEASKGQYDLFPWKKIIRNISKSPFVPRGDGLDIVCQEAFRIQCATLQRRIMFMEEQMKKEIPIVIGVSGGLDSTLALLVAFITLKSMGKASTLIHGITMPGFGTTSRTKSNAIQLMERLGVTNTEMSITSICEAQLSMLNHKEADITFENIQARARTSILFNYANKHGGMVLGTGDMSEIALGWMTYNGDSESHLAINSGIPKTLVRHMIDWIVKNFSAIRYLPSEAIEFIGDISRTPISPELLPTKDGELVQKTEDKLGPYIAHDFFLYWAIRKSIPAEQVLRYALQAFNDEYTSEQLSNWLEVFYKRFTQNQFKRNSMPDGTKVGTMSLSQRADWRMPSDMSTKWTNLKNL